MTDLVYHNGHYHRVKVRHSDRRHGHRHHHQGGLWRTTYELWDQVLYGIGTAYYKIMGR